MIEEYLSEAQSVYIKSLKLMDFPDESVKESEYCVKYVVRKISSGKSSLLNLLFNKKIESRNGINYSLA
jgi:hypothetical protein